MGKNKDEPHGEPGASESNGTRSQNQEREKSGAQLANLKENKHKEGELEEGELIESEDEEPANPSANLVKEPTTPNKEFDEPFKPKILSDNPNQYSKRKCVEVSLKRIESSSAGTGSDIPDGLPNKRPCLCIGKDDVDEAHNRIENHLVQLSLEITVPMVGLFTWWQQRNDRNGTVLQDVESRKAFSQTGWWHWFIAGSRTEGLCMVDGWGQAPVDQDTMDLHGGAWGVCMQETEDEEEHGTGCLVMVKDGCPPAYSRVLVDGCTRQMAERMAEDTPLNDIRQVARCFEEEDDGRKWLSSKNAIHVLSGRSVPEDASEAGGPAIPAGYIEYVPALIGSEPEPSINTFLNRCRGTFWPRPETLKRLGKLPLILVATGHKASQDWDLEWRNSWSIHELLLAQDMPHWVKQAYCGLKCTFKRHMSLLRSQKPVSSSSGRSQVGSYCLKTLLLWELEQPDVWRNKNSSHLCSLLLKRLLHHLRPTENGVICAIPNYFIPDCNLLECVPRFELSLALDCVRQIQRDPLRTIIFMPEYPWQVYGGEVDDKPGINRIEALDAVAAQHGEALVDAMSRLRDSHCKSEYAHCLQRLIGLLERLDDLREKKYELQCTRDTDETWKMVEQPSLCNLVTLARSLLQDG